MYRCPSRLGLGSLLQEMIGEEKVQENSDSDDDVRKETETAPDAQDFSDINELADDEVELRFSPSSSYVTLFVVL